jgi:hypothetical protein
MTFSTISFTSPRSRISVYFVSLFPIHHLSEVVGHYVRLKVKVLLFMSCALPMLAFSEYSVYPTC